MRNLHEIPSHAQSIDDLVRGALNRGWDLAAYQREFIGRFVPADGQQIDARDVVVRLERQYAALRYNAIDPENLALVVSRAEMRALQFSGLFVEAAPLRFNGMRLMVAD